MMINEMLIGVLAWMMGGLLGAIFFGGLWWTVRKSLSSQRPALWIFGSLMLRIGITMAGFYFVASGHWERLMLCLFGFILARLVVTWLTRSVGENKTRSVQEANHAP
jgi:F1F0 ATPase subunit 2